jgi:NRPS condensation-like uncharacterized protein
MEATPPALVAPGPDRVGARARRAAVSGPDVRPNLVDRLFLLLDGLQGPSSMNLYALTLDGMPAASCVRDALADVLAEQPLLRTRVTRGPLGYRRRVVATEDLDAIFTLGVDEPGAGYESALERTWMRARVDLSVQAPIRFLLRPTPEGARIVMGIHHSVADGIGGYFVLDRIAAHYTARLTGTPVEPPPAGVPARTYMSHFRRLPAADRRRALLGAAKTLGELVNPQVDCATFGDQGLPARGEFAWREWQLPAADLPGLKARARALGGTLNDLLLAAVAVAGAATWPDDVGRPHQVMVPVSLRDGAAIDPSNRVADMRFSIPAAVLGSVETAVACVKDLTPLARDRGRAFVAICQNGLVSRLPPGLIRPIVAKSLELPANQTLTFVFSNTGVLDPQPRDFGPCRVFRVAGQPPLTMPPGLGVVAATARGRLTLTIAWIDPALAAERVQAFIDRLASELRRLAAAA